MTGPGVTVGRGGNIWNIDSEGLPRNKVAAQWPIPAHRRPVVMVHGFQYNPMVPGEDNPHSGTFALWRDKFVGSRGFGFGWYSVPMGTRDLLRAWANGFWNRYTYAWALAKDAGRLIGYSAPTLNPGEGFDIVCHSLGSRVVMQAIKSGARGHVKRVLILNGAEHVSTALIVAETSPTTEFFNLVVETDDVLNRFGDLFSPVLGSSPCIGQTGLGEEAPDNWTDIYLDDVVVRHWGHVLGYDLKGDAPGEYWDHWHTFKHPGNHKLLADILEGKTLTPPKPWG